MTNKKQIKLVAQVGFTSKELKASGLSLDAIERLLVSKVSAVCGGCASQILNGWWTSDGASHASTFTGKLHKEITIELSVSCEVSKEIRTQEAIKQACLLVKNKGLPIQWVHLSRFTFEALHFDVSALASVSTPVLTGFTTQSKGI